MSKNTKRRKTAKKAHKKLQVVHTLEITPAAIPKHITAVKDTKHSLVVMPEPNAIRREHLLKQRVISLVTSAAFAKLFALAAVAILLVTTLFWSILSANLHQSNADQLIDAYLFENWNTFQQARFPGTHSFFIKWPLFAFMNLYQNTPDTFMVATVLMVLATVALLVYVLYKIETRLISFGIWCLALTSILLLIPAQPYPGALLPVNMAMTTTRNLEYAAFVVAVYFAVQIKSLWSRHTLLVTALLSALIASDNLFGVLAVGGALAAAGWYWIMRRQPVDAAPILKWLAVAIISIVIAKFILYGLTATSITNIINESKASPFELVHSATKLALGIIYGISSVLTNFGANPVHSVIVVQELPRELLASLRKLSIFSYTLNLALLCAGIYGTVRLLFTRGSDVWSRASVVLVGSTTTAFAVYVVTDHYYPVDARYLTVGLFAVTIAAATYFRLIRLRIRYVAMLVVLLLAVLPVSIMTAWQEYRASVDAMSRKALLTNSVSTELQRRKIDTLIGNYWDITPVKGVAERTVTIAPVDKCTVPRPVLTSGAWFKQPPGTPAAYLAIKDPSAVNRTTLNPTYDGCSLANIVSAYGVPSERVVIGGTTIDTGAADALLLMYANGIKNNTPKQPSVAKADPVILPVQKYAGLPQLQALVPFNEYDPCMAGTTLQIVAHEDDDLLFMNPDVQRGINEKRCIRTIFVTAGDAGADTTYWDGRERGSKAAYAEMYGVPNTWKDQRQIVDGRSVVVSYLDTVPTVALIYLRLPDGNMHGQGFRERKNQSLTSLLNGSFATISTVDNVNTYSKQELIDTLVEVMLKDLPDQIRTLGSDDPSDGDHSDHYAVGRLTKQSAAYYVQPFTLFRYRGYPIQDLPVNLSDDEITIKQSTFLTYAKFDGAVCQTAFECSNTHTYGNYLTRLYARP